MPEASPQAERSPRRRMLDGKLSWASSCADVPAAGYCVVGAVLFRNGEAVASVHTVTFDRDAIGHWVEYTAWPGSVLEELAPAGRAGGAS